MKLSLKCLMFAASLFFVMASVATAQETEPSASVNQVLFVDNFDAGSDFNLLGGETQGDEEFPGGCIPTFTADSTIVFGAQGQSLQLDYDVMRANSFSYYWSKLGAPDVEPGSSTPLDMRPYRYLSFWLKSSDVAPRFGIEIHRDDTGDRFFVIGKDSVSKVPATRFVLGENVNLWRKVVIPLQSFRQFKDWTNMLEFVFIFENKNRSKKGTLYVDDLLFGTADASGAAAATPIEKGQVFGYFKVNGAEVDGKDISVRAQNDLELFLKNIPENLERVFFETSFDGGKTWVPLKFFYEHKPGESYKFQWKVDRARKPSFLKASVSNVYGGTTVLSGPLRVKG